MWWLVEEIEELAYDNWIKIESGLKEYAEAVDRMIDEAKWCNTKSYEDILADLYLDIYHLTMMMIKEGKFVNEAPEDQENEWLAEAIAEALANDKMVEREPDFDLILEDLKLTM